MSDPYADNSIKRRDTDASRMNREQGNSARYSEKELNMAYFWIEYGLRGAYCDGNGYIVKADTRRELKGAIAWEASSLNDAGMVGANKRAVSWLANAVWKARKSGGAYPYVLPISGNRGDSYAWGIHCAPSCRADYLAQDG